MNPKLVALYFLGEALGLAVASAILFWSAGRLDWPAGWASVAVWLVWYAAVDTALLRFNPGLLAERLAPPAGAKAWDRALVSGIRLLELARYILAGLDQRYGWTSGFPIAMQLAAAAACGLSTALFAWALASNPFFSQVVRIQTDRGHVVAAGGPYRYVRHPSYLGLVVFELALSAVLASGWALAAGAGCALLIILRTALEDRTLQAELPGYAAYAQQVRYRLVPGLW